MYRCRECGAIFEEPNYMEGYWEDYNGVSSMFRDRHRYVFVECPKCGANIDTDSDIYDEEEEDDFDA